MKITHLILSGGGAHGCIYLGVFRYLYLENLHTSITHIASCSIGSFAALMFSFRLSIEEMEEIIYRLFELDKLCFIPRSRYISLFTHLGLSKTECITQHLMGYLRRKYPNDDIDNMTFMDISKKFGVNLYISTTDVNTCCNKIFCIEDTPHENVFRACEASMAIPFLFRPVKLGDHYYLDGGLTNNYPAYLFENVPCEYKFGAALNGKNQEEDDDTDGTGGKMTFFYLLKQFLMIVKKVVKTEAFFKYLDNGFTLVFTKIDSKWFKYEIHKNGTNVFNMSVEDINKMIMLGFHNTCEYFANKKKVVNNK